MIKRLDNIIPLFENLDNYEFSEIVLVSICDSHLPLIHILEFFGKWLALSGELTKPGKQAPTISSHVP